MENQEPRNPFLSVHVPLALIALAVSMLFFSQIKGFGVSNDTMKWQISNADKQITGLKDTNEKLAKAIEERKPLVAQSEQLQRTFTEMMKDVKALMDDKDEDAKKIIVGYGINIADNQPAPKKDK